MIGLLACCADSRWVCVVDRIGLRASKIYSMDLRITRNHMILNDLV